MIKVICESITFVTHTYWHIKGSQQYDLNCKFDDIYSDS